MTRLNELLARITELTDDELQELRELIVSQLPDDEVVGDLSMETLNILASAADKLRAEHGRRDRAAARLRQSKEVLASFRAESRMVIPSDRRPRFSGATPSAVTAAGQPLTDSAAVARALSDALTYQATQGTADGSKTRVVTITASGEGTRLTRSHSAVEVAAAVDAAAAAHDAHVRQALNEPTALTAAGGFGAIRQTDYTLPGFEVPDRPVRGALPVLATNRGGVSFMRSPKLIDLQGSVGVWTVQNDADATTNAAIRKPSLRVSPGSEISVDTQAVTNILLFGNLITRAYPEFVQRVTELSVVAHARLAEEQLLAQMGAMCTSVTGATAEAGSPALGATRVLLPLYERAAAGLRNRLRMPDDAPLQLILPAWARGLLRSDLAMQEPGEAREGVTDGELIGYLANRHLAPTWAMDGEAGQSFAEQVAGPVNNWPSTVTAYMFPPGAFQFLDGGTLDLGLVRDSTLNASNDYQLFSESFEGLLFRGGEALRINQAVTPSGVARAAA